MRLLMLLVPGLFGASEVSPADELPTVVERNCDVSPASTGLLHLRCGPKRLLIAQLSPVQGSIHDEILASVVDLVPSPSSRTEVDLFDPDLRRTVVAARRTSGVRNSPRMQLTLTSRRSSGVAAACVFARVDKRRVDRSEVAWCERMTSALLPAPVSEPQTRLEVEEPDLPGEDLGG